MKVIQAANAKAYGTDITGEDGTNSKRAIHVKEINKDLLDAINNSGLLSGETYDAMLYIGDRVHYFTNGVEEFNIKVTYSGGSYTAIKYAPTAEITDIIFIGNSVYNGQAAGALLGTLYSIGGASTVFTELSDINDIITISGNDVTATNTMAEGSYTVVIKGTATGPEVFQKDFVVTVGATPAITDITLSSYEVSADATIGTIVGTLNTVGGGTVTYSLTSALFEIDGSTLRTAGEMGDEGDTYDLEISATDGDSSYTKTFTILLTPDTFANDWSYEFDGSADYITVPYDASLDNSDNISVSLWLKPDDLGSGNKYPLAWWGAAGQRAWAYQINQGTGVVSILISENGTAFSTTNTTAIPLDTWSHVAFTFAAGALKIYINGVIDVDTTIAQTSIYSGGSTSLVMGGLTAGASLYSGLLDEVAIFDKVIDATEVSSVYNSGVPTKLMATSLASNIVGHWRMGDNLSGTNEPDETANGNNGTLVSMTSSNRNRSVPFNQTYTNTYAYNYNGTDERMEASADIVGLSGNALSFSFWLKKSATAGTKYFFGRYGNTGQRSVAFAISGSGGGFSILSSVDGSAVVSDTTATGIFGYGSWQHVVIVFDGSGGNWYIYINGALGTTKATAQTSIYNASTEPITLGVLRTGAGAYTGYYDGDIDEVTIYNSILSLEDVQDIYNAGSPIDPTLPASNGELIAHWKQGENLVGTTEPDEVGSADMTLTNMSSSNRTTGA